jgi:hypothetical protein
MADGCGVAALDTGEELLRWWAAAAHQKIV